MVFYIFTGFVLCCVIDFKCASGKYNFMALPYIVLIQVYFISVVK